jgi:DNA polymerase III subunit delta'
MAEDEELDSDDSGGDVAAAADIPSPRENPLLLGHEGAEAALLQAFNSGRLSHAWLVTGPRGIGKATLAYRFARFLLAEGAGAGGGGSGGLFAAPAPTSLAVAPSQVVFRQVASGGHPDLLVVERSFDPKRKRQRREIVADETRGVTDFLHLTSGQGGWRVVIVDGADLMNIHAANGLLKILEEPPRRTVLLLVSDNPGRLLPTIRSRCRTLPLKPLDLPIMIELLQRFAPHLSENDRAVLLALAAGSIGRALDLARGGGVAIYGQIAKLLTALPHLDAEELHGFADRLARSGADDDFALFAELLPGTIARAVTQGAGVGPGNSVAPEEHLLRRLVSRRGLDQWVAVWEKLTHLFTQAEGINLDRKQVVLNAFFALEEAAR